MLYIFEEADKLADDFWLRSIPHLSLKRREKVYSYRFPLDRNLSAAAYLLLRMALKENYGIDEPVNFLYGENKKPFLSDYPSIHFNLSHCRNAVACAISSAPIGVDVEEITPISDDVAKRVLTSEEYEAFKNSDNPSRLFCEYWVIKESYLKQTGEGITSELTALSADSISEKMLFGNNKDYCGCVTESCGLVRYIKKFELLAL